MLVTGLLRQSSDEFAGWLTRITETAETSDLGRFLKTISESLQLAATHPSYESHLSSIGDIGRLHHATKTLRAAIINRATS